MLSIGNKINQLLLALVCLSNMANSSENKPISFHENKGQIHDQYDKPRPDVLFSGSDAALVFHLKRNGIQYQITKIKSLNKQKKMAANSVLANKNIELPGDVMMQRIELNWLNCNTNVNVISGKTNSGFDNYYLESCPNGALEVRNYQSVTYQNLYKGIDLIWYEKKGHLKYDYNLAPGADYRQIEIDVRGAETIRVNALGQLIIKTALGEIIEEAPMVVQDGKVLPSSWCIKGNILSFQIQNYNPSKACTIDPLIRLWGTYYGGNGYDWVGTAYTDNKGNLFTCGASTSSNFSTMATTGAYQTTFAGGATWGDNYLVKFDPSGQRLWGTYYGGSGTDFANCCVVDANGDVYMSGGTTSSNAAIMTTPGCQQAFYGGASGSSGNIGDAYLAKFNTQGARLWSTYYGGSGDEWTYGMACDQQNNIYITGHTGTSSSTLISTSVCHQSNFGGGISDGFLCKFNSQGSRIWSTYYGGTNNDEAIGCITDTQGNIYIGGITSSTNNISTPASHQVNYGGGLGNNSTFGIGDAFLVKFDQSGTRQWGTYYGGSGDEYIYYCAVDASGDIYFTGSTSTSSGTAITSVGCHQAIFGGGPSDAMLLKFNSTGQRLWGTYYGGVGAEDWVCCVCDNSNNSVYISGITGTGSGTNIANQCAYQNTYGGGAKDAFLARFTVQGTRLYGTYYGSSGIEDWSGVAVNGLGDVYLTGETTSQNAGVMASTGAHQTTYGGGSYDAFIAKFNSCTAAIPSSTLQTCKGQSATISLSQSCNLKWFADSLANNLLYQGATFTTNPLFNDTVFWAKDISCGFASNSGKVKITTITSPTINIAASATLLCYGEIYTLTASGANTYTWASVTSTNNAIVLTATNSMVHGVDGSLTNGCKGSKLINIIVDPCLGLNNKSANTNEVIKIWPNPSNESFTLSGSEYAKVSIYNELGDCVRSYDLNQDNAFELKVVNLCSGIYLVQAQSSKGISCVKVLVQK